MCGDTEVTLDQLEEYVNDILAVPLDQSEHTHIELEFKVCHSCCLLQEV